LAGGIDSSPELTSPLELGPRPDAAGRTVSWKISSTADTVSATTTGDLQSVHSVRPESEPEPESKPCSQPRPSVLGTWYFVLGARRSVLGHSLFTFFSAADKPRGAISRPASRRVGLAAGSRREAEAGKPGWRVGVRVAGNPCEWVWVRELDETPTGGVTEFKGRDWEIGG
jgi:hypothetical protein